MVLIQKYTQGKHFENELLNTVMVDIIVAESDSCYRKLKIFKLKIKVQS